jgi:hypothetical protein
MSERRAGNARNEEGRTAKGRDADSGAIPRQSIVCPVCGMSTRVVRDCGNGTIVVECANPLCDSNLPPITEEER